MFLARNYTPYSLDSIGSYVNRDHATVLNGCRMFENVLRYETELKMQFEKIMEELKND